MLRALIVLAAISGAACFTGSASAAPLNVPTNPSVQQADWYCGPECQRHRYWEHRRWDQNQWRHSYTPPRYHNGYGYDPYRNGYGYYGYR